MLWYSQAGTPEVNVKTQFDEEKGTYTIVLKQSVPATPGQSSKAPMVIPLAMGLLDRNGRELPIVPAQGGAIDRDVLVLDKAEQTLTFGGMKERPVLSINRAFSAPVRLVTDLTNADFALLARHDSDPFNRWQALQTTAIRLLTDNVSRLRAGGMPRADDNLIAALGAILNDDRLEPAFIALALTPPGEGDIAREIGRDIDPDRIHLARQALREDIGIRLAADLSLAYERLASADPYSPDAASAGRRALRNVALDLMAATGASPAITRAADQYAAADNMTDRMAALATLAQHEVPERAEALADFYKRYADNALVIDKWFSLQAASPHKSALDKVRALTAHPAFSFGNPNRVRAVIGAFAQGNMTQFNRADGTGYTFVADAILAIDPKNPQLAARLATSFRTWRTLESGRRALAEAQLRRIKASPNLSRDLADIVERALG
jgi:aminopeptidase N